MTFILILVIQVQNLTFHWRHRTDVSGCKIGEGRSSLNLSKCQNLYQKMKLRVNQPAPAISNILKIPCSNTILIEEFLKMTVQIFKAMSCDKVLWVRCDRLVCCDSGNREEKSEESRGAESDWEYFWLIAQLKTRYIPRYCLYHGRRTGPYSHTHVANLLSPNV